MKNTYFWVGIFVRKAVWGKCVRGRCVLQSAHKYADSKRLYSQQTLLMD